VTKVQGPVNYKVPHENRLKLLTKSKIIC